jgi:nitroimidazol reductase NimA-like FMN-containing flavoprotein (pyridoxamine 5'-phosphate oxidase superfamily)
MRKSEKEIRERKAVDAVIRESRVCRLGMVDGDRPYVVPLCFGYDGEYVVFHSAREGRKMDLIRRNSRVCLEFDVVDRVVEADEACGWGIRYRSVIAGGRAEILEDPGQKRAALAVLMEQYAGRGGSHEFPDKILKHTAVIRVTLENVSGKHSKD